MKTVLEPTLNFLDPINFCSLKVYIFLYASWFGHLRSLIGSITGLDTGRKANFCEKCEISGHAGDGIWICPRLVGKCCRIRIIRQNRLETDVQASTEPEKKLDKTES